MDRDKAIEKIDDIANVVITQIPDKVVVNGVEYPIKEDITSGDRGAMLAKYSAIYKEYRERIASMEDVPESMIKTALILRRAIIFLKDFRAGDDIEDAKRWLDYVKRVGV